MPTKGGPRIDLNNPGSDIALLPFERHYSPYECIWKKGAVTNKIYEKQDVIDHKRSFVIAGGAEKFDTLMVAKAQ
ncbi:MAG: hypothetical protein P1U48_12200 [Pseudooceanicola sp.]|nr:hypothetical protein [Pseudooceanicola sp.]